MDKVLMVAFHYPPWQGSSGIQRTLKFTRYLPDNGWCPLVLTANSRAYPAVSPDLLGEIPPGTVVRRAFALDAARHLALSGRYPGWLAQPDRWVSWFVGAVPAGLALVRRHRPRALWSTHPIASAHLVGRALARLTGLPWIADFRDSMLDDEFPTDPLTRRSYGWVERQVVEHATRLVFTTESTRRMYLARYPQLQASRCLVIPNGYDEPDFAGIRLPEQGPKSPGAPVRLVHAGVIYPGERDPSQFFAALAQLKRAGQLRATDCVFDLRACGSEQYLARMITDLDIGDLVRLLPALPYRAALQDCADADALLILQGASCNHLVPAKVYEYLRLRRPILALTAHAGDTAGLLAETGGATVIDLADAAAIVAALPPFVAAIRQGAHVVPGNDVVLRYARSHQAAELAHCLAAAAPGRG